MVTAGLVPHHPALALGRRERCNQALGSALERGLLRATEKELVSGRDQAC